MEIAESEPSKFKFLKLNVFGLFSYWVINLFPLSVITLFMALNCSALFGAALGCSCWVFYALGKIVSIIFLLIYYTNFI